MSHTSKQVYIAHKINRGLERLIPITTPMGIFMGVLFPHVFIHLRPFVVYLFGLMTLAGALKLKAREMGDAVKKPLPIVLFFVSAHIAVPLIAFLLSNIIIKDPEIITGFVLLFAGPAAVTGFFWILIFKGDKALGLSLILLDTILAPLVVPASLSILIGKTIVMDMSGIAVSLLLMVVAPTIIGVGVNEASKGKIPNIISPYLDPFSKICLILVIAANASPVAPKINLTDPKVWQTAIVCIVMIIFGFILIYSVTTFFKIKNGKQKSILFTAGLKNNSATMTLAVTFFPEPVALPIIMSLLFQQTIAAFAGKIISKKNLQ